MWEVREGPVVEQEVERFLTNTGSAVGYNRENVLLGVCVCVCVGGGGGGGVCVCIMCTGSYDRVCGR